MQWLGKTLQPAAIRKPSLPSIYCLMDSSAGSQSNVAAKLQLRRLQGSLLAQHVMLRRPGCMLLLLGNPTCLLGEGASMGMALSPSMREVKASAADSMSLNPLLVPASMHCQARTSTVGQAVLPGHTASSWTPHESVLS